MFYTKYSKKISMSIVEDSLLDVYFIENLNYYLDKVFVLGLDIPNDYIIFVDIFTKLSKIVSEENKQKLNNKFQEFKDSCSVLCLTE